MKWDAAIATFALTLLNACLPPSGQEPPPPTTGPDRALSFTVSLLGRHEHAPRCAGVIVGARAIMTMEHCAGGQRALSYVPLERDRAGIKASRPRSAVIGDCFGHGVDRLCLARSRQHFASWAEIEPNPLEQDAWSVYVDDGVLRQKKIGFAPWLTYLVLNYRAPFGASGSGIWEGGRLIGLVARRHGADTFALNGRVLAEALQQPETPPES